MKELNEYDKQAAEFLKKFGIKFRATLSDSKAPPWFSENGQQGHHYRVTLSKPAREEIRTYRGQEDGCMKVGPFQIPGKRLTFDFWGSISDAEQGIKETKPYDVLACISGDVHCPESLEEFCSEYGYNQDSIKTLQLFRRCDRFGKRLREFFTAEEIESLSEIQ